MNPVVRAFSAASGSRVDIARTIMERNSSWDWNWRSPSAVSHPCQKGKSNGLKSGEHGGHVRSWISRSFKNASVRRLVCDGALSSCHRQLDVSAPRRDVMWQVHVVQHPNVAFGVDAHTLFNEARRENVAVHHRGAPPWCLGCAGCDGGCTHRDRDLPFVRASRELQPPKSDCSGSAQCNSSERTSRQRTPRASGPKASNAVCHGPRARPRVSARHGKSSILPSVMHGRA